MRNELKLLCSMLNERLTLYCNTHNLSNKEQIGFQKNSRTSDHILTLKAVVNKYVTDKEGKKLYTCFIDYKKAFDSVWHDGLFRKIENISINGNILDLNREFFLPLIKNSYFESWTNVRIIFTRLMYCSVYRIA